MREDRRDRVLKEPGQLGELLVERAVAFAGEDQLDDLADDNDHQAVEKREQNAAHQPEGEPEAIRPHERPQSAGKFFHSLAQSMLGTAGRRRDFFWPRGIGRLYIDSRWI